jgi:HD-GYP domain-containing protein (c-di-GMP phosphodiesterase class II)
MRFLEQLRPGRPRTSSVAAAGALLQMAEMAGACTPGCGRKVAAGAVLLGEETGMSSARLAMLSAAGRLLDIGLIGLPLDVAQRSRPLSEDEEAEFQLHPMRGLELVRELGQMHEALNGIMHHHERYDGRGYPMGLHGDEIPEFARILAIADEFERMTGARAGAVALSEEAALAELGALAGTHFDPEFVKVFTRVIAARQRPQPGGPTAAA